MLQGIKKLRRFAAPILIVATVAFFIYFFASHPAIRHTLTDTNPLVLLEIGLLYGVFILCLVWVYDVTLRLCGRQLSFKENFLLTCYSTIANFFGPLQSGPGVRAVYLNQKHKVPYRDYTLASLMYYALYAMTSALFLLVGSGKYWPLMLGFLICVAVGSIGIVVFVKQKMTKRYNSSLSFQPRLVAELFVATIVQLGVWAVIFYVELTAIHTGASFQQALAYGGTANLAVFVAMTPGAIGFREAFLAFTQKLHSIDTANILAASVIDRAVYVVFLGALFLLILALHADQRFRVKPSAQPE